MAVRGLIVAVQPFYYLFEWKVDKEFYADDGCLAIIFDLLLNFTRH